MKRLGLALAAATVLGCARAPSPLVPAWCGSIGTPNRGVLTDGAEPRPAAGVISWLRGNDRHWGLPRFAKAIEHAAAEVGRDMPGSTMRVGDLSRRTGGGPISPHFSHRSGVDADLLFYVMTLDHVPVDSPGFVHFGADGIGRDEGQSRWLRLDVEREWRLVKALVEDPDARIQWIFVSDVVGALLLDWAIARDESIETIRRAREVMRQPSPGGAHDDHIHVRTACSPEETATGCEPMGPRRPWLALDLPPLADSDEDLALDLMEPMGAP